MPKTIKFNLICDAKPVRTVEDLQSNFSIEDVLAYYQNKLLHRWLRVRGYNAELEQVENITTEKPIEIVKALIEIFHVHAADEKVEESVYALEYLEERKVLCAEYDKRDYRVKSIIDDYVAGYIELVQGIMDHPKDIALIKANIAEIAAHYGWIFQMDYRNLFYRLKDLSPLTIMCILMHEDLRWYYLIPTKSEEKTQMMADDLHNSSPEAVESINNVLRRVSDLYNLTPRSFERSGQNIATEIVESSQSVNTQQEIDQETIYNQICKMITRTEFVEQLGEHLRSFSGETESYWKDLEPKGKKYMIISMGNGDHVRASGVSGSDLKSEDVTNRFVILDGIDYMSNSSNRTLLYMEV